MIINTSSSEVIWKWNSTTFSLESCFIVNYTSTCNNIDRDDDDIDNDDIDDDDIDDNYDEDNDDDDYDDENDVDV